MLRIKSIGDRNLLTMRLFALLFLFVNIVALLFIPITPDEISRHSLAAEWVEIGQYDFSWPPMLMLINAFTSLIGGGPYITRVIFLVVELYLLWLFYKRIFFHPSFLILLVVPYIALVLSTASPQGLMVALLPLLLCAIEQKRNREIYLIALALYLTNPTCILILLGSAVVAVVFYERGVFGGYLKAVIGAIVTILIIAYMVFLGGGVFMPTLTNNGPLNLFLGNNSSALSYRGVAEGLDWMAYDSAQYLKETINFLIRQPDLFLHNYYSKLIYWFAPFDHIRSGIGAGYQYILFVYVGLVQGTCYFLFLKGLRSTEGVRMKVALLIFIFAWLAYSIFFVKLRFRIPFDSLLILTTFFSVKHIESKTIEDQFLEG